MTSATRHPSLTDRLGGTPFHPLGLAAFGVLSLYAYNLAETAATEIGRALATTILVCVLLLAALRGLLRRWDRAAIVASILVLLWFSYGHLYAALEGQTIAGWVFGRHRYLLPGLTVLAGGLSALAVRTRRPLATLTLALNLFALAALIMPLAAIASHRIVMARAGAIGSASELDRVHLPPAKGTLPDVYYIILDGYARSDYMLSEFGYDNRPFLDGLRQLGFEVAEHSHSNYSLTALSLTSALNMQYIQDMGLVQYPGTYPALLIEPIHHSQVRRLLEELGYRTIAFRSGYTPTEMHDADLYFDPLAMDSPPQSRLALNGFEQLLLRTSLGLAYLDLSGQAPIAWAPFAARMPLDDQATIALAQFQGLASIAAEPGPKFVFAHVLLPHYPYLFGPDGERLTSPPKSEREAYRDQAIFTSRMALEAIRQIVEQSEDPPIILIHADHGADREFGGPRQRFAILNAYLLPMACDGSIYPTITPINSFRVVFDCAFNAQLDPLPDVSYRSLSPGGRNFEFEALESTE